MPGILCVPSLTSDCYIQSRALKKTGRLTTQDVGKTLTLEKMLVRSILRVNRDGQVLLAEIAVWWHVPQGLQKEDRLLINLSAACGQRHIWNEN